MTDTAAYVVEGLALADEIRAAVMLPADEAMVRLGVLLARPDSADHRVARIRMLAAQEAVRRYGSQVAVAARTGLTRQRVSKIATGTRHR